MASLGERLGPLNPPMFLGDCTPKPPKYALDKGVNPSKNLGCPTSDPLLPLPFRSPFPLPSFPWRAPPPKPARGPGNGISSPLGLEAKTQPTNDLVHIWAKRSSSSCNSFFVDFHKNKLNANFLHKHKTAFWCILQIVDIIMQNNTHTKLSAAGDHFF